MKSMASPSFALMPGSEQVKKFVAFVQSKLFSNVPVQFIKAVTIAHQIVTGGGKKQPDCPVCIACRRWHPAQSYEIAIVVGMLRKFALRDGAKNISRHFCEI